MKIKMVKENRYMIFESNPELTEPYFQFRIDYRFEKFKLLYEKPDYETFSFTRGKEKYYLERSNSGPIYYDRYVSTDDLYIGIKDLIFDSGDTGPFDEKYYYVIDDDTMLPVPGFERIDVVPLATKSIVLKMPKNGNYTIIIRAINSEIDETRKIFLYDLHIKEPPIVPLFTIQAVGNDIVVDDIYILDNDVTYSFTRFYVYRNGELINDVFYSSTDLKQIIDFKIRIISDGDYKLIAHVYNCETPIIVRETNTVTFSGLPAYRDPFVEDFFITNNSLRIIINVFFINDKDKTIAKAYVESFVDGKEYSYTTGVDPNGFNDYLKFRVEEGSDVFVRLTMVLRDGRIITVDSNTLTNVEAKNVPIVLPEVFEIERRGTDDVVVVPELTIVDDEQTMYSAVAYLVIYDYYEFYKTEHVKLHVGVNKSFEFPLDFKDGYYACKIKILENATQGGVTYYQSKRLVVDNREKPSFIGGTPQLKAVYGNKLEVPEIVMKDPTRIYREMAVILYDDLNGEIIADGYISFGKEYQDEETGIIRTPKQLIRVGLSTFSMVIKVYDITGTKTPTYDGGTVQTSVYQILIPDIELSGADGILEVPEIIYEDRARNITKLETEVLDASYKPIPNTLTTYTQDDFEGLFLTVPARSYVARAGLCIFTTRVSDTSPVWWISKDSKVILSGEVPKVVSFSVSLSNGKVVIDELVIENTTRSFDGGNIELEYSNDAIAGTRVDLDIGMFDSNGVLRLPPREFDFGNQLGEYNAKLYIENSVDGIWKNLYFSNIVDLQTDDVEIGSVIIRKEDIFLMNYPFHVNDYNLTISKLEMFIINDNDEIISEVKTMDASEIGEYSFFTVENQMFRYTQHDVRFKIICYKKDGSESVFRISNELHYSESPETTAPTITNDKDIIHVPQIIIVDKFDKLRSVKSYLRLEKSSVVDGSYLEYDIDDKIGNRLTLPARDIDIKGARGNFDFLLVIGDYTPKWETTWFSNTIPIKDVKPSTPKPTITNSGRTIHIPKIVITDPSNLWREGAIKVYVGEALQEELTVLIPHDLRDPVAETITVEAYSVTPTVGGWAFIIVEVGENTPDWVTNVVSNVIEI